VPGSLSCGPEVLATGAALYSLGFAEADLMIVEGGVRAHSVPPSSDPLPLEGVSPDVPRTNLLPYDDGRAWHASDGTVRHHGGGDGGMWV
jgi:hypothetical protein